MITPTRPYKSPYFSAAYYSSSRAYSGSGCIKQSDNSWRYERDGKTGFSKAHNKNTNYKLHSCLDAQLDWGKTHSKGPFPKTQAPVIKKLNVISYKPPQKGSSGCEQDCGLNPLCFLQVKACEAGHFIDKSARGEWHKANTNWHNIQEGRKNAESNVNNWLGGKGKDATDAAKSTTDAVNSTLDAIKNALGVARDSVLGTANAVQSGPFGIPWIVIIGGGAAAILLLVLLMGRR